MYCHLLLVIFFLASSFKRLPCRVYNEKLLTSGKLTNEQIREVCGLAKPVIPETTGGKVDKHNLWPWMGAIYRSESSEIYCGCNLINYRFLLTAGHCVSQRTSAKMAVPMEFTVKLNLPDFASKVGVQSFKISKIIAHENYSTGSDIALVQLDMDVKFSESIIPICLPESPDLIKSTYTAMTGSVAAWSLFQNTGPVNTKLEQVQVTVMPSKKCRTAMYFPELHDAEICAGDEGFKRACGAEFGIPLTAPDDENQENLIGIASNGGRCGLPVIYTRVSSYIKWIKKNAGMT